ncbi:MAG: WbuC family cupin fold metalloprotein [bacterium]
MKVITSDLIDDLIVRAGTNVRRRINHNVHESPSDPVQRLFVAARPGSYFRPHRHPIKWEFAVVIRGRFDVMLFDDTGCVTERHSVGPGSDAVGFEIPPDVWHSWIPTADDSVFLEVKQGPYDAQTAAEFAAWSPSEGTSAVGAFVERLKVAKAGHHVD